MGIINEAKSGADLSHPRMSVGWVVAATVAVVVLLIAVAIGGYIYKKGKSAFTGVSSKMSGTLESTIDTSGYM